MSAPRIAASRRRMLRRPETGATGKKCSAELIAMASAVRSRADTAGAGNVRVSNSPACPSCRFSAVSMGHRSGLRQDNSPNAAATRAAASCTYGPRASLAHAVARLIASTRPNTVKCLTRLLPNYTYARRLSRCSGQWLSRWQLRKKGLQTQIQEDARRTRRWRQAEFWPVGRGRTGDRTRSARWISRAGPTACFACICHYLR